MTTEPAKSEAVNGDADATPAPKKSIKAADLYPLDRFPPLKGRHDPPKDFDTMMMDAARPQS